MQRIVYFIMSALVLMFVRDFKGWGRAPTEMKPFLNIKK